MGPHWCGVSIASGETCRSLTRPIGSRYNSSYPQLTNPHVMLSDIQILRSASTTSVRTGQFSQFSAKSPSDKEPFSQIFVQNERRSASGPG